MPIVPEKNFNKYETPESQKFRKDTFQGYKDVGAWWNRVWGGTDKKSSGHKFTDISPEVMAYMVAFLGGGVLTEIQRGINLATIGPGETGKNYPGYAKYNYATTSDLAVRNVYEELNGMYIDMAEKRDVIRQKSEDEAEKFSEDNWPRISFAKMWDRVQVNLVGSRNALAGNYFPAEEGYSEDMDEKQKQAVATRNALADSWVRYKKLDLARKKLTDPVAIERIDNELESILDAAGDAEPAP
jgi:hypothetical protein